uniref:Uncharacterized protein n=1 Tax=Meloidogyne enterolobii TaxID=390850 RepID=A0A6V7WXT2_MELEN|nr:unnamed protein product [Meloidogyne enterolobii]
MPRGGVYSTDSIKFEEYKYLEGNVEYKTLFETFNKAFERLVNKVAQFAQLNLKNINISLNETDVIANELKKYDEIVKNSKNVGEMLEEKVMSRTGHIAEKNFFNNSYKILEIHPTLFIRTE